MEAVILGEQCGYNRPMAAGSTFVHELEIYYPILKTFVHELEIYYPILKRKQLPMMSLEFLRYMSQNVRVEMRVTVSVVHPRLFKLEL